MITSLTVLNHSQRNPQSSVPPAAYRTLKLPAVGSRAGSLGTVVATIRAGWRSTGLGWTAFVGAFSFQTWEMPWRVQMPLAFLGDDEEFESAAGHTGAWRHYFKPVETSYP